MWPIDPTVFLSVDRVVIRHCEKDKVERECADEQDMAGRSDHNECE